MAFIGPILLGAVRRENLAIGDAATIKVAYVTFPQLAVTVDTQTYERTSERQYRFRSENTAFEAPIDVDDDALVTEYHGIWRRIA